MLQQNTVANQILNVIRVYPECALEELMQRLKEVYWSDVFLKVDRLSWSRKLRLRQNGLGLTTKLCVL